MDEAGNRDRDTWELVVTIVNRPIDEDISPFVEEVRGTIGRAFADTDGGWCGRASRWGSSAIKRPRPSGAVPKNRGVYRIIREQAAELAIYVRHIKERRSGEDGNISVRVLDCYPR
jgi:hypothetical protein